MSQTVDREALIAEANELGLEFAKNTTNKVLVAKIAEAKGLPAPVDEPAPPSPKTKSDAEIIEALDEVVDEPKQSPTAALSVAARRRKLVASQKAKAMKTQVVTVTDKDNRENSFTTTCNPSFENQYFGLSKIVPLDVPVELEQALIDILESTMMTLPKDEVVEGKRTGNKVATTVKRYAISYGKQTTE